MGRINRDSESNIEINETSQKQEILFTFKENKEIISMKALDEQDDKGLGRVRLVQYKGDNQLYRLRFLPIKSGELDLFQEKIKKIASLKLNHSSLLPITDYFLFQDDLGATYLVTEEEYEGVSLSSYMKDKTLNPVQLLCFLSDVFAALEYLHSKGITHWNLNEHTILVKDEKAYVSTYWLSTLLNPVSVLETHLTSKENAPLVGPELWSDLINSTMSNEVYERAYKVDNFAIVSLFYALYTKNDISLNSKIMAFHKVLEWDKLYPKSYMTWFDDLVLNVITPTYEGREESTEINSRLMKTKELNLEKMQKNEESRQQGLMLFAQEIELEKEKKKEIFSMEKEENKSSSFNSNRYAVKEKKEFAVIKKSFEMHYNFQSPDKLRVVLIGKKLPKEYKNTNRIDFGKDTSSSLEDQPEVQALVESFPDVRFIVLNIDGSNVASNIRNALNYLAKLLGSNKDKRFLMLPCFPLAYNESLVSHVQEQLDICKGYGNALYISPAGDYGFDYTNKDLMDSSRFPYASRHDIKLTVGSLNANQHISKSSSKGVYVDYFAYGDDSTFKASCHVLLLTALLWSHYPDLDAMGVLAKLQGHSVEDDEQHIKLLDYYYTLCLIEQERYQQNYVLKTEAKKEKVEQDEEVSRLQIQFELNLTLSVRKYVYEKAADIFPLALYVSFAIEDVSYELKIINEEQEGARKQEVEFSQTDAGIKKILGIKDIKYASNSAVVKFCLDLNNEGLKFTIGTNDALVLKSPLSASKIREIHFKKSDKETWFSNFSLKHVFKARELKDEVNTVEKKEGKKFVIDDERIELNQNKLKDQGGNWSEQDDAKKLKIDKINENLANNSELQKGFPKQKLLLKFKEHKEVISMKALDESDDKSLGRPRLVQYKDGDQFYRLRFVPVQNNELDLFQKRLKELVKLKLSHDLLLPITDHFVFKDDLGATYLVIEEKYEGVPLSSYRKDKTLSPTDLLLFLCDVFAALKYLHSKGITHWNLNEHTILIKDGKAYVSTYWLSTLLNPVPVLESHFTSKENAPLVAPECWKGFAQSNMSNEVYKALYKADNFAIVSLFYALYTKNDINLNSKTMAFDKVFEWGKLYPTSSVAWFDELVFCVITPIYPSREDSTNIKLFLMEEKMNLNEMQRQEDLKLFTKEIELEKEKPQNSLLMKKEEDKSLSINSEHYVVKEKKGNMNQNDLSRSKEQSIEQKEAEKSARRKKEFAVIKKSFEMNYKFENPNELLVVLIGKKLPRKYKNVKNIDIDKGIYSCLEDNPYIQAFVESFPNTSFILLNIDGLNIASNIQQSFVYLAELCNMNKKKKFLVLFAWPINCFWPMNDYDDLVRGVKEQLDICKEYGNALYISPAGDNFKNPEMTANSRFPHDIKLTVGSLNANQQISESSNRRELINYFAYDEDSTFKASCYTLLLVSLLWSHYPDLKAMDLLEKLKEHSVQDNKQGIKMLDYYYTLSLIEQEFYKKNYVLNILSKEVSGLQIQFELDLNPSVTKDLYSDPDDVFPLVLYINIMFAVEDISYELKIINKEQDGARKQKVLFSKTNAGIKEVINTKDIEYDNSSKAVKFCLEIYNEGLKLIIGTNNAFVFKSPLAPSQISEIHFKKSDKETWFSNFSLNPLVKEMELNNVMDIETKQESKQLAFDQNKLQTQYGFKENKALFFEQRKVNITAELQDNFENTNML